MIKSHIEPTKKKVTKKTKSTVNKVAKKVVKKTSPKKKSMPKK